MRKAIITLTSLLLILLLLAGCWYLFIYRSDISSAIFLSYADFRSEHGDNTAAAKFYGRSASLYPQNQEYCRKASAAYEACGNMTKAEYYLQLAVNNHPNDINAYLTLSSLYVRENKLLDCVKLIDECSNDTMRMQLEAIRPSTPLITPVETYSVDPISCTLSFSGGSAYVSLDKEFPSTDTDLYTDSFLLDYGVTEVSAVVVGHNGLVSPVSSVQFTVCGEIRPVVFSDSSFEEMIRMLLNKKRHDEIITSELWDIEALTLNSGISSLEDLAYFPTLKELNIEAAFADYSPLTNLKKLETLKVSGLAIDEEQLEIISHLTSLKTLHISNCNIKNITCLAALSNLTYLDASLNKISDITPIAGMSDLTEVYLQDNQFDSLSALAATPTLEIVNVSGNRIQSLGALNNCSSLKELYASGCGIIDISPLADKTLLTVLDVSSNRISSVDALSACTELREVNVSGNHISNIDVLTEIPSMENLFAADNTLSDCPVFPTGCTLLSLDLSGNGLDRLDGLKTLNSLHTLIVNNNKITSLSAVAELSSLVYIDAYQNPLHDVSAPEAHSIVVNYDAGYQLPADSTKP